MYEAAVLSTIILMMVSAADYIRRAWIRETHPVPASWILLVVMMGLSSWMYWESPRKSWTANIGITAGMANTLTILAGVIAANIHHGRLRVVFDVVQKRCLAAGTGIVVFWLFTERPLISYVLVQCIALIAYFAMIRRLWRAEYSTEPLFFWTVMLFANLCAAYPAWARKDPFSWIYLARAVPSVLLMIFLIVRAKRKQAGTREANDPVMRA